MQLDRINNKMLAVIYGRSERWLYDYLGPHRKQLQELATRRVRKDGRVIFSRIFNADQLAYIVANILDTPYGYDFINGRFVKNSDQ